jgi:hypothetical protein
MFSLVPLPFEYVLTATKVKMICEHDHPKSCNVVESLSGIRCRLSAIHRLLLVSPHKSKIGAIVLVPDATTCV